MPPDEPPAPASDDGPAGPGRARFLKNPPADRLSTILGRALCLRCPVCGRGRMFRSLLTMNERCAGCGLWFERESGYFLGSIYVNYGVTAVIATAVYMVPMLVTGHPVTWLIVPVVLFCLLFPIFFFRYARSLWLGINHYLSPIDPAERLPHEK